LRTSYFSNLDSGAGPLKRQNTDTVTLFFLLYLKMEALHDTQQQMQVQPCNSLRDAPWIAPVASPWQASDGSAVGDAVTFLKEEQGLLWPRVWRFGRVHIGYSAATPLNGTQGLLWRVAMSLRARCFFFKVSYTLLGSPEELTDFTPKNNCQTRRY